MFSYSTKEELAFSILCNVLDKEQDFGLAHGQMGICIYLFHYGRKYSSQDAEEKAISILERVILHIGNIETIDIESGITGIALGLCHLAKHGYIDDITTKTLPLLDNIIYKRIRHLYNTPNNKTAPQILYYFLYRLQKGELTKEQVSIYSNLCLSILNYIHLMITDDFITSNSHKDSLIDNQLPVLLFILGKSLENKKLYYKALRIINELSDEIISVIPQSGFARLFLLWGLTSINEKYTKKEMKKYIDFLFESINIQTILEEELKNNQIFINNGAAGILFLLKDINRNSKKFHFDIPKESFYKKIFSSEIWEIENNKRNYTINDFGIMHGITGIFLICE